MKRWLMLSLCVPMAIFAQQDDAQQWSFAEGLFKRGFYQDAALEYEALIDSSKLNYKRGALLRLITCAEKLKHDPMDYMDRYLELDDDEKSKDLVRMKKAVLLSDQEAYAAAEAEYKIVIDHAGELKDHALYEYGRLLIDWQKESEAIEIFKTLSLHKKDELSPVKVYANFALASLYVAKDELDLAKEHLHLLMSSGVAHQLQEQSYASYLGLLSKEESNEEYVTVYAEFRSKFPESAQLNSLGLQSVMALIRLKRYDEARGELGRLNNLTPEEQSWKDYTYGLCLYELGFFEEAIESFRKVENKNDFQERKLVKAYLFYSYIKMKQVIPAAVELRSFVKDFPQSSLVAELHLKMALLYLDEGEQDMAIKDLYLAQKTYLPGWANVVVCYQVLAKTLVQQERYKESAKVWLELAGKQQGADRDESLFSACESAIFAGDFVMAEEFLSKIVPNTKQKFRHLILLIESKISQKKYSEAVQLVDLNLKQDSNDKQDAKLCFLAGRAQFLAKELESAQKYLMKAKEYRLESSLEQAQSLLLLGSINEALRDDFAAAQIYSELFVDDLFKDLDLTQDNFHQMARVMELNMFLPGALRCTAQIDQDMTFRSLELCRIYARQERVEELAQELKKLQGVKLEGRDFCIYETLEAYVLMKTGDDDGALRSLEMAKSIDKWHERDKLIAFFIEAQIYLEQKQFDKSWSISNRAHILFNDLYYSPECLFIALQSAYAQSRHPEAHKLHKEMLKRFPEYSKLQKVVDFLILSKLND